MIFFSTIFKLKGRIIVMVPCLTNTSRATKKNSGLLWRNTKRTVGLLGRRKSRGGNRGSWLLQTILGVNRRHVRGAVVGKAN